MPRDTRVPVVWVEDSVRETRSQLDGTPGSAGAERCQKALDTLSIDDVKDDIVSSGACSAPGDKLPKPTLISSTMHTACEIYAWSKCNHPSILQVLGFVRYREHILLVSPWMMNGSLVEYVVRHPRCNRLRLSVELTSAVVYLHDMAMVHGDIKADNVLISDDGHVQLGDFGSAILLNYSAVNFTQTGVKGYLRFMAPELLTGTINTCTMKSDIYALGMTILQIMSGKLPYADQPDYTVPNEVLVKKRIPDRPNLSRILTSLSAEEDLWCLLTRCWVHVPESRPTAIEVKEKLVKLEWFKLANSTNELDVQSEVKLSTFSGIHFDFTPQRARMGYLETIDRETPTRLNSIPSRINPAYSVDTASSNYAGTVAAQSSIPSTTAPSSSLVPGIIAAAAGMAIGIVNLSSSSTQQPTRTNPRCNQQAETEHNLIKVVDSIWKVSSICTRPYSTRGPPYKDLLNAWCDRLGISHIRFVVTLVEYRDDRGRQLY